MATIAVGIDVGLLAGKGLDLVALDQSCTVVEAVRHVRDLGLLRSIVEELSPAVVCVDSPSQWSEPNLRRPAELELARRGINLYATPSAEGMRPFHHWMRDGFLVYEALAHRYPRYTGGAVDGTAAEYFPHASAVALAGHVPAFADKVNVRRALLERHSVEAGRLIGADQVDAALGALTGLIGLEGGHCWVGEGTDALVLPVRELPVRWVRDGSVVPASPRGGPGPTAVTSSTGERAPCLCGCGGVPAGRRSRFLPGHDNRVNVATGRRWRAGG